MRVKLFVVYKPQLATSRHFKGGSSGIRVIISNLQVPGLEQLSLLFLLDLHTVPDDICVFQTF